MMTPDEEKAADRMMRRMKKEMARDAIDPERGDYTRNKAEDVWVTPDGIECMTYFFVLPGGQEARDAGRAFILEHVGEDSPMRAIMDKITIPHGWYNGYVRLVRPLFRTKHYGDLLTYVPVHGGITHSAIDSEGCKIYGFDCGHAGDDVTKWTREATMREAERLALGLVVAAKFEEAFLRRAKPGRGQNAKWRRRRRREQIMARAVIVGRYHTALAQRTGIRFKIMDNFGALLNVLFGNV